MGRSFVGILPLVCLVAVPLSCRDGTGPVRAARVDISAERTTLVRNHEMQLAAAVFDANDNPLEAREVDWESSDETVLRVSATGLVRALTAGSARVTATVDGVSDDLTLTVFNGFPVMVEGFVFPFTSSAAEPLRVTLRNIDGESASAMAGSGGAFSLTGESATESFDVMVTGDGALHFPALMRLNYASSTGDVRFVMTPKQWSPPVGSYVGTTVSIDPIAAFAPPEQATNENRDGFWPGYWMTGIKVWSENISPAPLAFDHARSNRPITSADSAAFWATVRQMEEDLGRPLFFPITISQLTLGGDGWASGAVIVRIDTELNTYQGYASWRWDGSNRIYAAYVRLGSAEAFRHTGLVTHELLHTQGFKHTCSWPTVMGSYGCPIQARLTPEDVAHAQLAFAMRATERSHDAAHALVAAFNAQRVLEYGLEPMPIGIVPVWSGAKLLRLPLRGGEDGAH